MFSNSLDVMLLSLAIATALRAINPSKFSSFLLAATLMGSGYWLIAHHTDDMQRGWHVVRTDGIVTLVKNRIEQAKALPGPVTGIDGDWPPVVGGDYPNLRLIDQNGRLTSLSEFRGKVILVEPIGLPCPACVAFAGGHQLGPFAGVQPQLDLKSIKEYARQYGQVDLDASDIVLVHLLLYGSEMKAPTPSERLAWAEHFGLEREKNQIVLSATEEMLGPEARAMIPGFQLIDRDFVLRADSTGHQPQHDLYSELLPMLSELLK